ncbi:Chloride transport protein 6 [Myotis davidii]|uniref:Chloride transport protein 6 n=1 Tax=Myotis davidii TaxID=225400 RepID=L5LPP0_MYODS|nr:Chloride transport protein 6 [Myotis davidii]
MELRPDTSQKENVYPRPATPLRPGKRLEQRRLPKSLGVILGSGQGLWVPRGQAKRGEPATTPSPRAALRQEPCQVQTNLASPRPRLGLALKDTAGRLINSRFQQQSNLQPLGVRPLRGARAFTVQQSNLSTREAGLARCGSHSSPRPWLEPQEGFWPHGVPRGSPQSPGPQAQPSSTLKPSWLLATDMPCPRFGPTLRCAPTDGHTQPAPRSWGGLGDWPSRLMGEPLTLDDLAVPEQSSRPQQRLSPKMGTGRRVTPSPSLRLWEEWAGLTPGGSDDPQGGHSFPSILLGWSHWSMAQGAQRKLAARWAWDRSCRDALGLWRWQEAEQWAQERGRRQVRDALQHWHSSWQRQQCLHDRYQGWVQLRRQGLRRATFQSWRQAAAHQRHRMARPERLALQRVLEAWAQSAAQGRVQRVAIAQFEVVGHRQLLRAHWAQWQTELLSLWLEPWMEAQETSTAHPGPRADLTHWPGLVGRGCLLALMDTAAPWKQTILGETQEEEDEILPRKDYESLDYDRCINDPYLEVLETMDNKVGLFVDFFVRLFTQLKFGVVQTLAAGSGIPEIKCYLNGVKVPGIVRLRTLVCKVFGVLFSVAGGLFVGKEGPMIHSGAVVGAGLPQFQSISFQKIQFNFPYFRSDRDKRDFVSAGAAAGVAAAFGAPIGGTLFSLEEGSSFWNQGLTWKVLFCSMSATFTLNFFRSGIQFGSWGSFQLPGLLNFGEFKCSDSDKKCHLWTAVDLGFFVLMGVIGGLLGATFNCLNKRLAKYRMRNVHPKPKLVRVLESLLVSLVTTVVVFVASMVLGECRQMSSSQIGNDSLLLQVTSEDVNSSIKTFFCPNETYNDMATLFFNPQESAILQLFHQDGTFSPITLALFFILYFLLACWTYGISVPSGLFVPSLLCGAAFGRLVANVLKSYIGLGHVYSGTFALIGAAAFLGGVVRMTISLTVILIESTNEITYGLPIMITLMVAKWTGDFFNKGIYDIHVGLRGVPLLEWETEAEMDRLRASDIMEPNLTYVYPHTRIQSLVSILRTTVHHAFPVVTENRGNEKEFMKGNQLISNNIKFKKSSILTRAGEQRRRSQSMKSYPSSELRNVCDEHVTSEEPAEKEDLLQQMLERRYTPYPNLYPDQSPSEDWTMEERFRPLTFHGLILRSQLVTLLVRGVCYSESQSSASQPRLSYAEMAEDYPRYPDIHDLDLTGTCP